jgi:hypothetical protein
MLASVAMRTSIGSGAGPSHPAPAAARRACENEWTSVGQPIIEARQGDALTRARKGLDLDRADPLEVRKATLTSVVAEAGGGIIRFNEHLECDDGETVFRHACKMGLEGIVSKRKDSPYKSGCSPHWLKMKNPACAAVKREAEEDWGKRR